MRTLLLALLLALALSLSSSSALAQEGPVVSVGPPVVEGALQPDVVQGGVEERLKAVGRCYAQPLASTPGLYGHAVVRLAIGANGEVTSASLVEQTLGDQGLATCIAGVLQVVPLSSPPAGEGAEATVPLLLTPAPVILPRKGLEQSLRACQTALVGPDWSRTVLARIDVEGGRATAVEVKRLGPLDEPWVACVSEALKIGPHRVGTASRWYQWELPQ